MEPIELSLCYYVYLYQISAVSTQLRRLGSFDEVQHSAGWIIAGLCCSASAANKSASGHGNIGGKRNGIVERALIEPPNIYSQTKAQTSGHSDILELATDSAVPAPKIYD